MFTVYSLIDPRDNSIRYIGITEDVYSRMRQHSRCEGNNGAKNAWVQELQKQQLMFIMHSIEKVRTFEQALEREAYWIRFYLAQGIPLLNVAGVPNDPTKPYIKQYKPYQVEPKKLFFQAYTGRVVSVWRATDEEFDEFIKRYVGVEEDPRYPGWPTYQRRRFIAHVLNKGIQPEFCAAIEEDESVFIKRGRY